MCVLGGALGWLCWRLLEQDRQLESQRAQERLERAADRTAGELAAAIREFESELPPADPGKTKSPPEGVTLLLKTEAGMSVWPAVSVPYLPSALPVENELTQPFAEGERLEFQEENPATAAERFRALAASRDPEIRAGALLRLGRNLRKLARYEDALGVYGRLAAMKEVVIEGVPADLIALDARCGVLEAMARGAELRKEAGLIDTGLRNRRWNLPGPAWELYQTQASRRAGAAELTASEREAVATAQAAEWAAQLWPRPLEQAGRRVVTTRYGSVLICWSADSARLGAVLAGPALFQKIWEAALSEPGAQAALVDADSRIVMGSTAPSGTRAVRSPAVKGMAAALVLTWRDPAASLAGAAVRKRFLLAGFALLAMVLGGGGYFMVVFVSREREVAKMQTEFVATVSHEFRTPLTSIKQFSEMLARGRIVGDLERQAAYDALLLSTERLQRLVESLLDFGRMDAATFRYHFDRLNAAELVMEVVEAFRRQGSRGHDVILAQGTDIPAIRGDREALGIALWNLLDNAVKYSPGCPAIWVETRSDKAGAAISVRDLGPGIEGAEQARIFEKFVRGTAAWNTNTKGTGIGLSMAQRIALAHGGEIRLDSRAGEGSTFTLVLPEDKEA